MKNRLLLLILFCCPLAFACKKTFELEINDSMPDNCYQIIGDVSEMTGTLHVYIEENTFNDTIVIDNIKLPPLKTGEFEFIRGHNIPGVKLCFQKYKAKKGKIVFKASF